MSIPNWKNRTLFHGDNLEFMRAMNSESVDLIATDPPFKKGKDFHATPDSLADGASFQDRWSWERDVHQEWVDQITDDFPLVMNVIKGSRNSYGDDMGAFLCFMAVRLLEMRRVLKPRGSIYLHCDPTASHYLKELMDAVFGKENFRSEIFWRRNESGAKGSQHDSRAWGSNVDSILFYAKTKKMTFDPRILNDLSEKDVRDKFPRVDEKGERYNTKVTAWRSPSMGARPNLCYEFRGFYPPYPSGWRLSRKRMEEEYQKGNIVVLGDKVERRSYLRDYRGVTPGNLWADTELLLPAQSSERTGFPTQKPLALYERIIKASSKEEGVVLDPFAGCATTLVAAERLGRQWVGIDLWDNAHGQVIDRLKKEGLAGPDGDPGEWLIRIGDVRYTKEPPERTDGGDEAAPFMLTPVVRKRVPYRWERLSRAEIVGHLVKAQLQADLILCAGCGRSLEMEFMELDHIRPRATGGSNDITNRILLCRPCNGKKKADWTLYGLMGKNRKDGWMKDEGKALAAQSRASEKAEQIRIDLR